MYIPKQSIGTYVKENICRVDSFFLFFSVVCVAALLSSHFWEKPVYFNLNFIALQVVARLCVPMLLLMAAHYFFRFYRESEEILQKSFYLFRKGMVLYLVYAVLYLATYYFIPVSSNIRSPRIWFYFLRGLISGAPPCSWMILSFLVGVVLVACLITIRQKALTILIISFLLHTVSIFTEIYFKAIMHNPSVAEAWNVYSRIFVTTRNGFFYGFFWCALGYVLAIDYEKRKLAKHDLFFFGAALTALTIEHSFAYSMGWPRDYKSSFMMIPVCVYLFFWMKSSTRSSGRSFDQDSLFNKHMFIAFMLLPQIEMVARLSGVPVGSLSLFAITLSADFVISYFLAVFSEKIHIKGHKLLAW